MPDYLAVRIKWNFANCKQLNSLKHRWGITFQKSGPCGCWNTARGNRLAAEALPVSLRKWFSSCFIWSWEQTERELVTKMRWGGSKNKFYLLSDLRDLTYQLKLEGEKKTKGELLREEWIGRCSRTELRAQTASPVTRLPSSNFYHLRTWETKRGKKLI